MPHHLSFAEAATIPIAFLTAYYGLHHLAQISSGDRILIHSAAGGLGLAAVQLAQRAGAEVFGTASRRKWAYLKSVGVQHVMDSRSLDFADEIMAYTEGEGVDIVLNTLTGAFIPKSLLVLAAHGRFVEVGVTDIWDAGQVAQVRSDVKYFQFRLLNIAQERPAFFHSMFREIIKDFAKGHLKPLPRRVFPVREVISAFRTMVQAKHIGKIVVSHEQLISKVSREASSIVSKDGTYLITGGLGGLGLRVARWLIARGAWHLVLVGRSAPSNTARQLVHDMEREGVEIVMVRADVAQEGQVAEVLAKIGGTMPPLRGVIHAAGVLDDGVLQQQTWERFAKVMAPKVEGAWNLHTLTKHMPLDFFVLFSSMSSLWGTPGQGNYAVANAFLDALAHHRRAQGLAAVSINWGPWAEVGMAAAAEDYTQHRRIAQGIGKIDADRGLQVLGHVLREGCAQVGVVPVDWPTYMQQFAEGTQPPFLSEVAHERQLQVKAERPSLKPLILPHRLAAAPSSERYDLLVNYLREKIAHVLGAHPSQLDVRQPLNEIVVDSLIAIELRNGMVTDLGIDVPIVEFFKGATISEVATLLRDKFGTRL
jgi:myxalamid-type polyketide synthase MxaB